MNKYIIGILLSLNSLCIQADSIVVPTPIEKSLSHTVKVDRDSLIETVKFQPNFKVKYQQQSEFNYSSALSNDSIWVRIKNFILSWLERLFSVRVADQPAKIWDFSLNIISVLLIAILAFYIVRAIIRKEVFWFFKKSKKAFEVHHDVIEKNLHQTDFKALIDRVLEKEDHRLAIRYYYLWLLKILSKKEIIQWDLEKTNSDYLSEIKNEEIKKSFQYLSYLYNNIWYGEFDVDLQAFKKAQQAFKDFLKPWRDE